jgi:hypothetical protein
MFQFGHILEKIIIYFYIMIFPFSLVATHCVFSFVYILVLYMGLPYYWRLIKAF